MESAKISAAHAAAVIMLPLLPDFSHTPCASFMPLIVAFVFFRVDTPRRRLF